MPYIELPDARLFFEREGDEGSPVLLIMGFGAPGKFWRGQVPVLSQEHQVAWFDNAGSGNTSKNGWRPLSTGDLARHAMGVMDALGWSSAHIVGVSMGGMIAQEIALRHRSRVRSLSLVVTHAGGLATLLPSRRGLSLFLKGVLGPRRKRVDAFEQLIYPEEYLSQIDRQAIRQALQKDVVSATSLADHLSQLAAVVRHRTEDRLHRLAGLPTLIVEAGKDVLIRPEESRRLHRLIPGSRLVAFHEAGHAVLHQCADELNAELLHHFGGADRANH